jgi:hypothetical protein
MEYRKIKPNNNKSLKLMIYLKYSVLGQSLFEVIIAIGVAALILVASVSLSTASVRNSNFSKNNAVATKYAQEGSEYIREQRDTNWDLFMANYTGSSSINLATVGSSTINSNFTRQISQTVCKYFDGTNTTATTCGSGSNANIVDVYVTVSWTDGQGTHNVKDVTTLSRWRN